MDLHTMKRKQLQALCKKHGVPANLKNVEMANKLSSLFKEKPKPITRGKSCLKSTSDVVSDNDSQNLPVRVKKVRFSPKNEIFEFVHLENSDQRNPRAIRAARRRSMMESVSKKANFTIQNDVNSEDSDRVVDDSVISIRSRTRKSVVGDVIEVLSSPISKKVKRVVKSASTEVKKGDNGDKPTPFVELDGAVDSRKVLRRSKRVSTKAKDIEEMDMESEQVKISRRITRSAILEEEASAFESGKGTAADMDFEVQEEPTVLHPEKPSWGFRRKASRQKSVVAQNGKVRSDGVAVDNETKNQSENSAMEGVSDIEASAKIQNGNEKGSVPKGTKRNSRRKKSLFKSSAPVNVGLDAGEVVASNKPLELLGEEIPRKGNSERELLRRARCNISKHDHLAASNGMDLTANAKGKNGTRKRRGDPILEEDTSVTKCKLSPKDPPRQLTRYISKQKSVINAGLSVKALGEKMPQDIRAAPIVEVEEASLSQSKEVPKVSKKRRRGPKRKSSSKKQYSEKMPPNRSMVLKPEVQSQLLMSSHSKEVLNESKKKVRGSNRTSSSDKRSGSLEVCPLISEVEEIIDPAGLNLEETPATESAKLTGVTTDQELQICINISSVAMEKEIVLMDKEQKTIPQDNTSRGDDDEHVSQSQHRGKDEQDPIACEANLRDIANFEVTSLLDGFSALQESDCVGKPDCVSDLDKELGRKEDPSQGTHACPRISLKPNDASEYGNGSVHKEQNSADSQERNGLLLQLVDESFNENNESGATKKYCDNASEEAQEMCNHFNEETINISLEREIGEEDEFSQGAATMQGAISVCHELNNTFCLEIIEECKFNRNGNISIVRSSISPMIDPQNQGISGASYVSGNHTLPIDNDPKMQGSRIEAEIMEQCTIRERSDQSRVAGKESSSYDTQTTDEVMSGGNVFGSNAGDGKSSQDRTYGIVAATGNDTEETSHVVRSTAVGRGNASLGPDLNCDVELIGSDSDGQSLMDQENESSEENSDNASNKVTEKASTIVNEDKFSCEHVISKGNERCQEDQFNLHFSIPVTATTSVAKEKSSSHEVETMGGIMSNGGALLNNLAVEGPSAWISQEILEEHDNEGISNIETTSPISSTMITDEGFKGDWSVDFMGEDGRVYSASVDFPEASRAGVKEIDALKINCAIALEEGRRNMQKLSPGEEITPLKLQERESVGAQYLEGNPEIHEIDSNINESSSEAAEVEAPDIEPDRKKQCCGIAPLLTPIHLPECQGSHTGNRNMSSSEHNLSEVNPRKEQEGNELEDSESDIKCFERDEASLHETNCWPLTASTDEGSYKDHDVVREIAKAASEKIFTNCGSQKIAFNERVGRSIPRTARSVNKVNFDSDGCKSLRDGTAEGKENNKTPLNFAGHKILFDEKLIKQSSPELVSMESDGKEEALVDWNCSGETTKDVASGKYDVVSEVKFNDYGLKEACHVEHCAHVIKEGNAEFCRELELDSDDDDCCKVVAKVYGSAYSNSSETKVKERKKFEEKVTVENCCQSITTIDMPKEELNEGTSQPLGTVGLDCDEEYAKMNLTASDASCDTVLSEASDKTSGDNVEENVNYSAPKINSEHKDRKDVLTNEENETIPLEELMSIVSHQEVEVQEFEQSHFIASDELVPAHSEAEGMKEFRTVEGELKISDENFGAAVFNEDASAQDNEKESGNQTEEEKDMKFRGSNLDDHKFEKSEATEDRSLTTIGKMDVVKEVENEGTLLKTSQASFGPLNLGYTAECARMKISPPGASDEAQSKNHRDSENISDDIAETLKQVDEANFGSLEYHKEETVLQVQRNSFATSDRENGEAAVVIINKDLNTNIKNIKSDFEKGVNINALLQVTSEGLVEHLVQVGADLNVSDSDARFEYSHDNSGLSEDEACQVTMDQKNGPKNGVLDVRLSPEVKLFPDASCSNPEMGSSDMTVSSLAISLSNRNKTESLVYFKDIGEAAESEEKIEQHRGDIPMDTSTPFQNDVTLEKSKEAKRGHNSSEKANGSSIEESVRNPPEYLKEQFGDHEGGEVKDCAFMDGINCWTLEKPLSESESKSFAEESKDGHDSLHEADDKVVPGGESMKKAVFNGGPDFEVESCVFSSREIDFLSGDCEGYEDKEVLNPEDSEDQLMNVNGEDLKEVNNATILKKIDEDQVVEHNHYVEDEAAEVNNTDLAPSDELIFNHAEASSDNDVGITTKQHIDSENNMKQFVEANNSCGYVHNAIVTKVVDRDKNDSTASDEPMSEGDFMDQIIEFLSSEAAEDGEKCAVSKEEIEISESALNLKSTMLKQTSACHVSAATDCGIEGVADRGSHMVQSSSDSVERGNNPMDMSMPCQNDVALEKSIEAKGGHNSSEKDNGSFIEENVRNPPEKEQFGNHEHEIKEGAFMSGFNCWSLDKTLSESESKNVAEDTKDGYSLHKFDDKVIPAGESIEIAVSNGDADYKVESCMVRSREIDDCEGYEDKKSVKPEDSEYQFMNVSGADPKEVNNATKMKKIEAEQVVEHNHFAEKEAVEANNTDLAASSDNNVAITTEEHIACETKIKKSVETDNSCGYVHGVMVTEIVNLEENDSSALDEPMSGGNFMDPKAEIFSSEVAEVGEKCEVSREEIEMAESALNSKSTKQTSACYVSATDSGIEGIAGHGSQMVQSSSDSVERENPEAKLEGSISLSDKQLKFSMTKRKSSETSLIERTPKKPLWTLDMKENKTPMIKREQQMTMVRSVTKRRPLEDIQKNQAE